jgi:hypothetical protein
MMKGATAWRTVISRAVLIIHHSAFIIALAAGVCAAQGDTPPPRPDPRFGIVETFVNPDAAREAGAGFTRIILRWDVIQPDGPADWKPANVPDPFVARELADGRQVVGLLIGTPAWASADGTADARAVPRMDAWAAFTRRMAQHYRGRIHQWIIWNEPDVWDASHPGSTWLGDEADYARLLKTAYRAIKEVDPTSQVALAGQTYYWDWTHGRRRYLDRLLDILAADPDAPANGYFFDVIPYHLYFNPTQAPLVIGEARAALARRGITGKEIWINETNAPPSDDGQELPWSAPRYRISLAEQAAFVIQQFSQAFAAGASRVAIYKLRNSPDHPESIEPFGLLRGDDSRRPAFAAFRAATTYLGGFRGVTRQQMGEVVAITFDRGGQTTTVLWTWGRAAARAHVRAIAPSAVLVDELGQPAPIAAVGGRYVIDLPGAQCNAGPDCSIGGAPRLLVETGAPVGAAGGRVALIPAPSHTPTTTPPPATPAPTITATATPAPTTATATATPTAAPPATRTASPSPTLRPATAPPPTVLPPAASATPQVATETAVAAHDWRLVAGAGAAGALLLSVWAARRTRGRR